MLQITKSLGRGTLSIVKSGSVTTRRLKAFRLSSCLSKAMTESLEGLVGARGRGPGDLGMLSRSTHAVHCPDIAPRRWSVLSLHWSVVWWISFLNSFRNESSSDDVIAIRMRGAA